MKRSLGRREKKKEKQYVSVNAWEETWQRQLTCSLSQLIYLETSFYSVRALSLGIFLASALVTNHIQSTFINFTDAWTLGYCFSCSILNKVGKERSK